MTLFLLVAAFARSLCVIQIGKARRRWWSLVAYIGWCAGCGKAEHIRYIERVIGIMKESDGYTTSVDSPEEEKQQYGLSRVSKEDTEYLPIQSVKVSSSMQEICLLRQQWCTTNVGSVVDSAAQRTASSRPVARWTGRSCWLPGLQSVTNQRPFVGRSTEQPSEPRCDSGGL